MLFCTSQRNGTGQFTWLWTWECPFHQRASLVQDTLALQPLSAHGAECRGCRESQKQNLSANAPGQSTGRCVGAWLTPHLIPAMAAFGDVLQVPFGQENQANPQLVLLWQRISTRRKEGIACRGHGSDTQASLLQWPPGLLEGEHCTANIVLSHLEESSRGFRYQLHLTRCGEEKPGGAWDEVNAYSESSQKDKLQEEPV